MGRISKEIRIRSVKGETDMELPFVIECDEIPHESSEVPTPDVARSYRHLLHLASDIPELNDDCKVQLLIGRDVPEIHHVINQVTGDRGMPFAQQLCLGWVIVGEVCLGKTHVPDVSVRRTYVLPNGRSSRLRPCQNNLNVKEEKLFTSHTTLPQQVNEGCNIFIRTREDDKPGLSWEDREFLGVMDQEMTKDDEGYFTALLPFKPDRTSLPCNNQQAWHRAQILDRSLKRDAVKREHFSNFMTKVLNTGAAEVAPSIEQGRECWYLPLFGVYHPKKPGQIRGVFDASAVYQSQSLNKVLMSGPDMTNSQLGILLRFRKDKVAATADVEQMFYRFRVHADHRDYLRFFWYRDNDVNKDLIEYRMKVHVFGNTSSPAVATYGLRRAVQHADEDVKRFVNRDFYVDDALTSKPEATQTVELMKKTQSTLQEEGHIRLHKIASNSPLVMSSFPTRDLGNNSKSLELGSDEDCCLHRSLGVSWDILKDVLTSLSHDVEYYRR